MKELDANIWKFYGPKNILIIPINPKLDYKHRRIYASRGLSAQAQHKFPKFSEYMYRLYSDFGWSCRILPFSYGVNRTESKLRLGGYPVLWQKRPQEMIEAYIVALRAHVRGNPFLNFYIPRIGCGNAGFKWADIRPTLNGYLVPYENVFIVHNSLRKAKYERPDQGLFAGQPRVEIR